MADSQETEFILLRKIPYGEHGMIVKGISPDLGQCGFVAYGAYGGPKRSLPELELFRLLRITCESTGRDLQKISSAEIIEDFGGVSRSYANFQAASWIAQLSLLNTMAGIAHPFYCNAVSVALRRLASPDNDLPADAVLAGVCLAFIFEEGWLAPMLEKPESAAQLRSILEMASGRPAPQISLSSWTEQFSWCKDVLLLNECRLP